MVVYADLGDVSIYSLMLPAVPPISSPRQPSSNAHRGIPVSIPTYCWRVPWSDVQDREDRVRVMSISCRIECRQRSGNRPRRVCLALSLEALLRHQPISQAHSGTAVATIVRDWACANSGRSISGLHYSIERVGRGSWVSWSLNCLLR